MIFITKRMDAWFKQEQVEKQRQMENWGPVPRVCLNWHTKPSNESERFVDGTLVNRLHLKGCPREA